MKSIRWTVTRWWRSIVFRLSLHPGLGWRDAVIALILFAVSFTVTLTVGHDLYAKKQPGWWWQPSFVSGALGVCAGEGVKSPVCTPQDKVYKFIEQGYSLKDSTLDTILPGELPKEFKAWGTIVQKYPGIAILIGYWWNLLGQMSWQNLVVLLALWHAVTLSGIYLFYRLFMGRIQSVLFMYPLIFYLDNTFFAVTSFRDSGRELSLVVALFLLGMLLQRGFRWRKVIWTSLPCGLFLGFSFGMRSDFVTVLPFAAIALFFFQGSRRHFMWIKKMAFTLIFAVAFAIGYYPAFQVPITLENEAYEHVVYIGMTPGWDEAMGLQDNPYYKWGTIFNDWYGNAVGCGLSLYRHGEIHISMNKKYAANMRGELLRIAGNFPGDIIQRALVANVLVHQPPYAFHTPPGLPFATQGNQLKKCFHELPNWFFCTGSLLMIFLIGIWNWRKAWLLCTLGLMLFGITAVQFMSRHYTFYLFLVILGAGFCIHLLFRLLGILLRFRSRAWKRFLSAKNLRRICRNGGMVLLYGMLLGGVWYGAESWQNRNLRRRFAETLELPRQEMQTETHSVNYEENLAGVSIPALTENSFGSWYPVSNGKRVSAWSCILVWEFEIPENDPIPDLSLTLEYDYTHKDYTKKPLRAPVPAGNFTTTSVLPITGAGRYYYVTPVYYLIGRGHFQQLTLPAAERKYLTKVLRITEPEKLFYNGTLWIPPVRDFDKMQLSRLWENIRN